MKPHFRAIAIFFSMLATCTAAFGQVSLTSLGTPYTQDFNTLGNSGESSTVPTGWAFSESGTSLRNDGNYTATNGADNAGDTYSYGALSNTERAFGVLFSSTFNSTIGASFTNNSGSTITALAISYTGEQWRAGVISRGAADRLDFQYSTNATDLTTGTWTDANDLDLNSPNISAATTTLDGNAAGNRASISFTITGLSIANGATFWIRWTDFDISLSDDGLAVDDFSMTPNGATSEIDVQGNSISIADGDNSPVTGDNTDFGSADVTSGTVSRSFTLHNTGAADLLLTGTPKVQISGAHAVDFTVTLQPSSPLIPNNFTIFAIVFDPSASGLRTATVSIDNNDSDEHPYNFAIQGTGTVACASYTDNRAYVNASASGANNGTSWTDAFIDLQDALAAANACPGITEIWVAEGIYKPTTGADRTISFVMKNNLAIYGGFDGTETLLSQRDWVANPTILSGDLLGDDQPGFINISDNSKHVISNSGLDNTAVLDGFTITAANANNELYGGGMINNNASPTVTNCVFSGNTMTKAGVGNDGGGGMVNLNSSPIVTNCAFSGNSTDGFGGGMYNQSGSTPTVTNCIFSGNTAQAGGGMCNLLSSPNSPIVTNCTFSGNTGTSFGGGVYLSNSPTVFTNCTFSGNSAGLFGGGGLFIQNSSPTIMNCSFSGNIAAANGGAVRNFGSTNNSTLKNCILWGNSSDEIVNDAGSTITVTFSIVQQASGVYPGTGNLNQDPLFVSQPPIALGTSGDLHLQPGSPAINAGTNTGAPSTDIEGNTRPLTVANPADMGAYEAKQCPSAIVSGGGTICAGGSAKITANLAGASPFTIIWSDGFTETNITSTPHDRFVSPSVTTTYTITSISNATCTGTATGSALVTVNPLPMATVSGGGTICVGASATISASLTGTGPWSITWVDGFMQTATTSPAMRTVSPSITTTYTITAVSDANCTGTSSGSAKVTVGAGGIPTATVTGGGTICAGKSTTIRATLTGTAPWTITWSDGFVQSGITSSPATRTVSPSKTTTYTVIALSSGGCAGTFTGSATVQVNKLPKAVVHGDATICDCGSTDITIELSGTPPWTINWADGTVQSGITERTFKRTVKRDKTYRIVSVKDGNGCSSTGEGKATINVLDEAVFAARDWVKIGSNLNSEGAIYTNGYIEFGAGSPGKHTGNLTAGDDIVIKGKNQINGQVKAGDLLLLAASSQIIGTRQDHAEVDKLSMPHSSVNANGPNKTVPAGVTLNLPPGSYGKVLVQGTLVLTAGRYNLRMLNLESLAILSINVAGGEVKINVGTDLNFANNSRVEVNGGSSALVWFTAPQDRTINIGADAVVQGKIIGADADVIFGARSRFKGSVCARTIRTEPKVIFLHYSSLGTVAKDAAATAETAAVEAAVVTAYELAPNYPNPFSQIPRFAGNVGTEITFALPEAGKVSLNVYSTTGQLVRTLVDRELETGRHQAQWNGRNEAGKVVAAGVYLYRITVLGRNGEAVFTETRRLTFLK